MTNYARCVCNVKDKRGRVTAYLLLTQEGEKQRVSKQELVEMITSGLIRVVNLKIAKDGRIINHSIQSELRQRARKHKRDLHKKQQEQ